VPPLIRALRGVSGSYPESAKGDDQAIAVYITQRKRIAIIRALGQLGPMAAPAVPLLTRLYKQAGGIPEHWNERDQEFGTVLEVLDTLGRIGEPAGPVLLEACTSNYGIVRSTGTLALKGFSEHWRQANASALSKCGMGVQGQENVEYRKAVREQYENWLGPDRGVKSALDLH